MKRSRFPILALMLFSASQLSAQSERSIGGAVSYISSGSIYLDAGRSRGLAEGDTVTFRRGALLRGKGVITALSSSSSAVRFLPSAAKAEASPIAIGDSAYVFKEVEEGLGDQPLPVAVASSPGRETPPDGNKNIQAAPTGNVAAMDNRISGRVALQYAQAGAPGLAPDFSQPSVFTRLNIGRLFGTGMNLSFFARTYRNAALRTFDEGSRTRVRLYDLALSNENPDAAIGWSAGRVTSTFVGGFGQVDGGQVYVRHGKLAVGLLAGLQPDYRTSGIETTDQKGALFVHYGWEGEQYSRWDGTIAYGRQFHSGKLDRDFLYIQNSARLGLDLFLYQSTEIDLHRARNGERSGTFRLTNTYATVSYSPLSWLTASAGYDATRNVYLMESMKLFPDTLFDVSLRQGYRASLSLRLPLNVMVTGTGRFRPGSGAERKTRSLGGGVRFIDLGGTGVSVGGQYTDLTGIYTNGRELSFDADGWVTRDLCLMFRYDRYAFDLLAREGRYVTITGSAILQWRISRSIFSMINYDRVWDTLRDSERLMCEFGIRF